MCGIAGVVNHPAGAVEPLTLRRMADAIVHRVLTRTDTSRAPGSGMASRRLSIVGLADGRQPIFNEDRLRRGRLQRRAVRLPRAQAGA